MDVHELVRRVPGWALATPTITPIETGLTNRNFRVDVDGRSWVVRIPGERTELLGIDRAGEAEAARRAAELGIAPSVRGELPGVGTLVTEFVEAQAADAASLAAPGVLEAVVGQLRRFHGGPPLRARFPIFRVVEWHARDAAAHGLDVPPTWAELHDVARRIETGLPVADLEATPCHNDLLPANVLLGADRTWLIDWEYAGMGHAGFDLANLAVNCAFDEATDERLLAAYDGPVNDRRRATHTLMKFMSELREGMWAVVQQAISTLDHVDFESYATERLDHAAELAASSTCRDALAAL